MKKILYAVITAILILSLSLTAFAAPQINEIFVDENGDMYFFGTFDWGATTAGVMLTTNEGNSWYPIHPSHFYHSDTYGRKFGICLKDTNGKLAQNGPFVVKAWEIDRYGADVLGDEINIDPLNNPATVIERDVLLNNIYIDGTALEGFSNDIKEYTVELAAGYLTYPDITAETNKKASKYEITYSDFNGDAPAATITVTNGELEPAVFTISFVKTAAAVSDAKVNAELIKELTGNELTAAQQKVTTAVLAEGTLVHNDRDVIYENIPEDLLGATAIQLARELTNKVPNSYSTEGDMVEFKINHTADIYMHIDNLGVAGGYTWVSEKGFTDSGVIITRWGTDSLFYKKTVVVEPGTTETVSLGFMKQSTAVPSIIVKFRDTLPEASGMIENAKAYKTSDDSYIRDVTVLENIQQVTFADDSLTGEELYASSNLVGGVKSFIAREHYLYNSPMLNGSDYLQLGINWSSVTGSGSESYYCTFDLTESATIYVNLWNFASNKDALYSANPWLADYEWIYEDRGFEVGYIYNNALTTKSFGFKKTIEVDEGKEVKTVKVGPFMHPTNSSNGENYPMIFVKPEN